MFKRIKENPKYIKFKELWANPKTHSMIVLGFWLIFMAAVIIFVRLLSVPTTSVKQTTNYSDFSSITSYDFSYKTKVLEINGQTYKNDMVFYLNNKRYYYHDNVYLIQDNTGLKQENFDINVLKINITMLNSLVSGITPTKVGDYKQYLVPLDRFINLYEIDTEMDLSKAATYNIVIKKYTKDNKLNKIELDLSSYFNYKNGTNIAYPLTINYYNLNNVSDFTKEYDQMIGGK